MKQVAGWWLPQEDEYMAALLEGTQRRSQGRALYQDAKRAASVACVPARRRRFAIDVGAHVGLWSWFLADEFDLVLAFEPNADNYACLVENCADKDPVRPRRCALGEADTWALTRSKPGSSADTEVIVVDENTPGVVPVWALDNSGELGRVDYIKLDCIGRELPALQGMQRILTESRPVVCVEQKPGYPERFGLPPLGAVEFLKELGARVRHEMSGVYVLDFER